MWNIILNTLENNKTISSKNNPSKDGHYLCTCISKIPNSTKYYRYLRIMEYKKNKDYWHDIGNEYGISHTILAWKEQKPCTFKDFKYDEGILFEK